VNIQNLEKSGFEKIEKPHFKKKDIIKSVFHEYFGTDLGDEIPFLLSDVSGTEYDKLIEDQKLFEKSLEQIFKNGAKILNDSIAEISKNNTSDKNTIKKFLDILEKTSNIHVVSLFFQNHSFRNELVEKYLLDSKNHNIASSFFGKTLPHVETISPKTYDQIIVNGSILLNKVQENISEVISKNTSNKFARIACQETSIFKERGILSQYFEMAKNLNGIENSTVLFCFKEAIMEDNEINKIAMFSDLIIQEESNTIFQKGEKL
jgi:hypothetical protein